MTVWIRKKVNQVDSNMHKKTSNSFGGDIVMLNRYKYWSSYSDMYYIHSTSVAHEWFKYMCLISAILVSKSEISDYENMNAKVSSQAVR
jgi:hypothetical protein